MKNTSGAYCPIETTIKLLEKKWTLLIIRELSSGKKRFCNLQQINNINPRALSLRLKEIEQEKIIKREVIHHFPPWVEYELTEKGKDLTKLLQAMNKWASKWVAKT